ncbi:MAG: histidine acid phosphatase, partial [Bacteroidales bacterium]|nr:histidine acid phosphatase [Bacteroidales bacterium]
DSAHQLVDDIVAKADEAIAGGKYAVDLRFGHDYPLLTLVSYLGVEGPGSRMPFSEIASRWWCWRELCMGSNLQMIFYRNRKGHVLVKFLYQEQERSLRNLQSVSGPYYDWETVKANIQGYRR